MVAENARHKWLREGVDFSHSVQGNEQHGRSKNASARSVASKVTEVVAGHMVPKTCGNAQQQLLRDHKKIRAGLIASPKSFQTES